MSTQQSTHKYLGANNHAVLSTARVSPSPQGQSANTTPASGTDLPLPIIIGGGAGGVVLIVIIVLVIYIWYRRKYPVRMVLGKDFQKFSNPAYTTKKMSALKLVVEDPLAAYDEPLEQINEGYNPDDTDDVRHDPPAEDEPDGLTTVTPGPKPGTDNESTNERANTDSGSENLQNTPQPQPRKNKQAVLLKSDEAENFVVVNEFEETTKSGIISNEGLENKSATNTPHVDKDSCSTEGSDEESVQEKSNSVVENVVNILVNAEDEKELNEANSPLLCETNEQLNDQWSLEVNDESELNVNDAENLENNSPDQSTAPYTIQDHQLLEKKDEHIPNILEVPHNEPSEKDREDETKPATNEYDKSSFEVIEIETESEQKESFENNTSCEHDTAKLRTEIDPDLDQSDRVTDETFDIVEDRSSSPTPEHLNEISENEAVVKSEWTTAIYVVDENTNSIPVEIDTSPIDEHETTAAIDYSEINEFHFITDKEMDTPPEVETCTSTQNGDTDTQPSIDKSKETESRIMYSKKGHRLSTDNIVLEHPPPTPTVVYDSIILEPDSSNSDNEYSSVPDVREQRSFTFDLVNNSGIHTAGPRTRRSLDNYQNLDTTLSDSFQCLISSKSKELENHSTTQKDHFTNIESNEPDQVESVNVEHTTDTDTDLLDASLQIDNESYQLTDSDNMSLDTMQTQLNNKKNTDDPNIEKADWDGPIVGDFTESILSSFIQDPCGTGISLRDEPMETLDSQQPPAQLKGVNESDTDINESATMVPDCSKSDSDINNTGEPGQHSDFTVSTESSSSKSWELVVDSTVDIDEVSETPEQAISDNLGTKLLKIDASSFTFDDESDGSGESDDKDEDSLEIITEDESNA